MSSFSDLTVRGNGDTVDASWWNSIRTALITAFGGASTSETQQSISDGAAATNVTSLSFSSSTYRAAKVEISAIGDDGTNQRRHIIDLNLWYNSKKSSWALAQAESGESCTASACISEVSGLTFTITSGGQVQVASDTMGGSPTRKIRWKITSTFGVET